MIILYNTCIFVLSREFLLQSSVLLLPLLPHTILLTAGVSHCPLTPPASVMMREDLEGEGFQTTGGRKEERERVRTHLEVRKAEVGKPRFSLSLLGSQSCPLVQPEGLLPHQ